MDSGITIELEQSMPKLAALVDGHTESSFLQRTYPADHILIIRCLPNGADVTLTRIAETIVDKVATLSGDYDRVLILLDREARAETCAQIATDLAQRVGAAAAGRSFIYAIKNIEVENWILADEVFIRSIGEATYNYAREGQEAKSVLSSFFKESLSPQKKAAMLAGCSPNRMSASSQSFADFARDCAPLNWWWLGAE